MLSPIYGKVTSPSNSAVNYMTIGGGFVTANATESVVLTDCPDTFTISKLYVKLTTAPASGKSWDFVLMKNGSPTSLTVTISGTAVTATDSSNSVSFAAGDTFSLRSTPTGTPTNTGDMYWNMTADGTGQLTHLDQSINIATTTIRYIGYAGGTSSTESQVTMIAPTGGVLSKMYIRLSGSPGGTDTITVKHRVNGADSGSSIVITGAATTGNDTSNTSTIASGDRVNLTYQEAGTQSGRNSRGTAVFTPTIAGYCMIGIGNDDLPTINVTEYTYIGSDGTSLWTGTETDAQMILGQWMFKSVSARRNSASGGSYVLTLRSNAADTALAVTLGNNTTVTSASANVAVAQGDLISLKSASGSGTTRLNVGFVLVAIDLVSTFSDNFDDNSISASWTGGGAQVVETNQQLQITTTTAANYFQLFGTTNYDLTGSSMHAEIVDAGNQALTTRQTIMYAEKDTNNKVYWQIDQGNISVNYVVAGTPTYGAWSATYVNATHRWVKIYELSGRTYFDYSADGITWTPAFNLANPIALISINPGLQAGNYAAEASTSISKFDNFNITPSAGSSVTPTRMMMGLGS